APPGGSTGTIDRALDMLEFLREAILPQRLADIAAGTGLSPSSAHRILAALGRRAYVYRNPLTRRYSLGFQVFDLGETGSAMMMTTRRSRPALVRLAADIGASVFIGTRNGPASPCSTVPTPRPVMHGPAWQCALCRRACIGNRRGLAGVVRSG
ncbi:MAG: helix-turn-helix domain-containing protein, partial [Alphaproteobacteria bacterium]|nr:helix-turn-helix domain-containing protein [Alphaproteobacteria bacterium]